MTPTQPTFTVNDIIALINLVVVVATLFINSYINRKSKLELESSRRIQVEKEQKNYWFKEYILDNYMQPVINYFDTTCNLYNEEKDNLKRNKTFRDESKFIRTEFFIHLKIFDPVLLASLKEIFAKFETDFNNKNISKSDFEKYKAEFIEKLFKYNCEILK